MTPLAHTRQPTVGKRERWTSVIVPVSARNGDLSATYHAIIDRVADRREEHELLFVFEGADAADPSALIELARNDPRLRLFGLSESFGEAMTLRAGIDRSRGDTIVVISRPSELNPAELESAMGALAEDVDLVVVRPRGQRRRWLARLRLKLLNALLRPFAKIELEDVTPRVQAMRRDVAKSMPLYGSATRIFPAIAAYQGIRVVELQGQGETTPTEPRGWVDDLIAFTDALTIVFVSKFVDRPLRFFGLMGTLIGGTGGAIAIALAYQRLFLNQGIANRPLLLLAVLLVAVGVQVIGLGLVGEIIVNLRAPERTSYSLRRTVRDDK